MTEDTKTPEPLSGSEIVYEYRDPIYHRPVGRGICLIDTEPEQYLEYAIDAGAYYMDVVIRKLPASYQPEC